MAALEALRHPKSDVFSSLLVDPFFGFVTMHSKEQLRRTPGSPQPKLQAAVLIKGRA